MAVAFLIECRVKCQSTTKKIAILFTNAENLKNVEEKSFSRIILLDNTI